MCLLFLAGCTEAFGTDYTVYIHPDFGSKVENVVAAASRWHMTTGVNINTIISFPHHCNDPGTICMYLADENFLSYHAGDPFPRNWFGLTHREPNDTSNIWILDNLVLGNLDPVVEEKVNLLLEETVAHEFGHAFGLHHDPASGTLMYWKTDGVLVPTCKDIKSYFSLREIDYCCQE